MSEYLRPLQRNTNADKLLATAGVVSVFAALIVIARTTPATGYELTIYQGYPVHFWVLLVAAGACGIGILVHQAFAAEKSRWWLAGLLLVISSNSVLIGLPFFRGYGLYPAGDVQTHVGMMKDIMATGHVGSGNFYPVMHVLAVSLLNVTGLSHATVASFLAVSFSTLYVLNVYLLATEVAVRRGQALLIVALACPLLFSYLHTGIFPSMLSIFMLPLLLYLYHRRQRVRSGQLATIMLLALLALWITVCHPVTAIFTIGVFLACSLALSILRRLAPRRPGGQKLSRVTAGDYVVPITGLGGFSVLLLTHPGVLERLRAVRDFFGGAIGGPPVEGLVEAFGEVGLTASQTLELFMARYGVIFMCGVIAGIAVMLVLRIVLSRKADPDPMNFLYAVVFVVGVAAAAFSLFGFTGETGLERISRLFLIVAPVFSGLVFYDVITGQRFRNIGRLQLGGKAVIALAAAVILAAQGLSIFAVYSSPRVMRQNWQVTQMEITGTAWFSTHRDTNIGIFTARIFLQRYNHLNFGVETSAVRRVAMLLPPIPSGFGYDAHRSIAEALDFEDTYLLTANRSRMAGMHLPENVRATVPLYPAEGFARLRADPSVAQIYANGEFEVWMVYGE